MLQSQLFAGDANLEACLVHDSAHILQGAIGDHVSKIQVALFILDQLVIDKGELSGKTYGPSTAQAVLAFKTERNIVNRQYETQPDNIVGKMTIARLDKELHDLENPSSQGFGCVIYGRRDYLYLGNLPAPDPSVQLGFLLTAATAASGGAAGGTPPTDEQIMQKALKASRDSLGHAVLKLDKLMAAIKASKGKPLDGPNLHTFLAVVKWLRVSGKNPAATVPTIQAARVLMANNQSLKNSAGNDPPLARGGPITLAGGVVTSNYHGNSPGSSPDRGADFGDAFFNHDGPNCRRDVVTHEFFHMLGVHHGGGPTNGATIQKNITTPAQALDSCDNLAQLAAQLTTHGGRTDACTRNHE